MINRAVIPLYCAVACYNFCNHKKVKYNVNSKTLWGGKGVLSNSAGIISISAKHLMADRVQAVIKANGGNTKTLTIIENGTKTFLKK